MVCTLLASSSDGVTLDWTFTGGGTGASIIWQRRAISKPDNGRVAAINDVKGDNPVHSEITAQLEFELILPSKP